MLSLRDGLNRSPNVVVRPHLLSFIRKLGWATGCEAYARRATEGNVIRPGSFGERSGDTAYEVGKSLLWESVLSKFDDGKSSIEKEQNCWARFSEAEAMCSSTNEFLRDVSSWPDTTNRLGVGSVLSLARSKIEDLLKGYCELEHSESCAFSSGASTRLPRRYGLPPYKYSGPPETTIDNVPFGNSCIHGSSHGGTLFGHKSLWARSSGGAVSLVDGNRVTSVAKNWKTNRAIAIEPDLNMYVQKGIGRMIRTRLKRVGIDLDDQRNNQRAAYIGSVDESLATVDLSMASDTVSFELVKRLLPWDWFCALVACRSHQGSSASRTIYQYEKFSSMGNGATFELESLLFWAICQAACQLHGSNWRSVLVYGDDLILPGRSAQYCCDILQQLGFKVNTDKSHFSGPYRESCGKHYWNGADVTPFFVKKEDSTLAGLFKLHNQLYRWIQRTSHTRDEYARLMCVLKWLRGLAPSDWQRPRIPDGIGDVAFVGSFDEACPKSVVPALYGWEGWLIEGLVDVALPPKRKKSKRRGVRGPILVATSLRLSADGFLCSLLSSSSSDNYLPHLGGGREPWSGLSQDRRYQVKRFLVPHFP